MDAEFSLDRPRPVKPVLDIQVIVLAGGAATRMQPLTAEGRPKALLPVANRPMLWYCLDHLHRHGYDDIVVVTRTIYAPLFEKFKEVHPKLRFELATTDGEGGSADALRGIQSKIKTDFMVVSCDLVTDAPLHRIVDLHRVKDATVTSVLYQRRGEDLAKRPPEAVDYFGLDASMSQLLMVRPGSKVDENGLKLRTALLQRHPLVNVYSNLYLAHLFVFKHWVIHLINERKSISSIQRDLLPLLVKNQDRVIALANPDAAASDIAIDAASNARHLFPPNPFQVASSLSTTERQTVPLRCSVFVLDDTHYCERANSIATYCEVNRQVSRAAGGVPPPPERIAKSAELHKDSQVGPDSMVGDGTRIDERTVVKRSVVGRQCVIGRDVKIINSVLMDHVTVPDRATLENVVVGSFATLGEDCNLKDCEVSYGATVGKGQVAKREKFL